MSSLFLHEKLLFRAESQKAYSTLSTTLYFLRFIFHLFIEASSLVLSTPNFWCLSFFFSFSLSSLFHHVTFQAQSFLQSFPIHFHCKIFGPLFLLIISMFFKFIVFKLCNIKFGLSSRFPWLTTILLICSWRSVKPKLVNCLKSLISFLYCVTSSWRSLMVTSLGDCCLNLVKISFKL